MTLAASVIAAPVAACAADVPTPELKSTYEFENARYQGHSPSGRYLLYEDETAEKVYLFDTKDGSQYATELTLSNDCLDQCFSTDEKYFYYFNKNNGTVVCLDLSSHESKEYSLGSAIPDGLGYEVRLQISKDKKFLYITSLKTTAGVSDSQDAVFAIFDYKNSNVITKYEFPFNDNDYLCEGPAWISDDGKYGYVVRQYGGDDYDSNSTYDVVTIDLGSKKVIKKSQFDDKDEMVSMSADGTALGPSCFISKKGKVTDTYFSNLEYKSLNQDGSLVMGLYNEKTSRGIGSSSSELASLELIIVDNKTGKTKWKTKYPSDIRFTYGRYTDPITNYGAITDDGLYALGNARDENGNHLLYLINTKTGAHSHINLRNGPANNYSGNYGYDDSTYFSNDNSKIYAVQEDDNDDIRLDIYKSGISKGFAFKEGQDNGHSSAVNPVFIVVGVAVAVAAGVGGFFIVRARKASKAVATSSASAGVPVASQPMVPQAGNPQQVPSQAQQTPAPDNAPRFCAACGSPLVPGARFCPRCGAPVKR